MSTGLARGLEPATIANGAALSDAVHLHGLALFALQMPASWTAADLTFQGSVDGTTYADVYDEAGDEVTVPAAAARFILLDPAKFLGLQRLKIRSGTTGVPVNQGAARTIQVIAVG
jgi:hypothetical protein